jgi:hypothetical protein
MFLESEKCDVRDGRDCDVLNAWGFLRAFITFVITLKNRLYFCFYVFANLNFFLVEEPESVGITLFPLSLDPDPLQE